MPLVDSEKRGIGIKVAVLPNFTAVFLIIFFFHQFFNVIIGVRI